MNITNKKVSLVLSGGAARGAFHLGVISALERFDFEIMAISGSSIGAIVGAGYLSGKSPKELLKIFTSRRFKNALKFNPLKGGLFYIDKDALVIDEIVSGKEKIEDLNKPLHVSVTDLGEGRVEYRNRGYLKELLLASSALVPLFPAQKVDGRYLADGGIVDNFPLSPIRELNYPIIGVNLHPNAPLTKHNILSHLGRAIFLGWHAGVAKSIQKCDYYIAPNKLSKYPVFRFKYLQELFELGEKATKEMLNRPS